MLVNSCYRSQCQFLLLFPTIDFSFFMLIFSKYAHQNLIHHWCCWYYVFVVVSWTELIYLTKSLLKSLLLKMKALLLNHFIVYLPNNMCFILYVLHTQLYLCLSMCVQTCFLLFHVSLHLFKHVYCISILFLFMLLQPRVDFFLVIIMCKLQRCTLMYFDLLFLHPRWSPWLSTCL